MIIRSPNRERWVTVDNRAVEDSRLSLRAKGLLLYILSKPDHWQISPTHLATTTTDGITCIRSCLKELKRLGYATLETITADDGKLCGTSWVIHELSPTHGFTEIRADRNSANPTLVSTDKRVITERKKRVWRLPPELSALESIWDEWLAYKRERRSPMTPQTFARQVAHLKRLGTMRGKFAIEQSIENGWQGIFDPKSKGASMPYKTREDRINKLNERKRELVRSNAPFWKINEINMQLNEL